MSRRNFLLIILAGVLLVIVGAQLLRSRIGLPRFSEEEVRQAVYTAIQREADTTFVVTGYLEVVATVESENTRILLPDLLDVRLGTSRSRVRVPGRVAYGFDIGQLTPAMISVSGDTVEMTVPLVTLFLAEPDLARMEVETSTGWARLPSSAVRTERRAVQLITDALRQQGLAHLRSSSQPQVNTARALRRIVEPVVVANGIDRPHFRMHLGEGLLIEP